MQIWRKYFLKYLDIDKVLVSYKISFGEKSHKYFIGYLYNDYKGDELSEQNITIWDKVSPNIKKQFDSEPVYNKKFLKTKMKSHGDEFTDFYDKKLFNSTLIILVKQ